MINNHPFDCIELCKEFFFYFDDIIHTVVSRWWVTKLLFSNKLQVKWSTQDFSLIREKGITITTDFDCHAFKHASAQYWYKNQLAVFKLTHYI